MPTLAKSEHHLRDVCKCTTIYSTQIVASHCLIEIKYHIICQLFLPSLCLPMPTMAYIFCKRAIDTLHHFLKQLVVNDSAVIWVASYLCVHMSFVCVMLICLIISTIIQLLWIECLHDLHTRDATAEPLRCRHGPVLFQLTLKLLIVVWSVQTFQSSFAACQHSEELAMT